MNRLVEAHDRNRQGTGHDARRPPDRRVRAEEVPSSKGLPERVRELVKRPLAWDETLASLGKGLVFIVDEKGERRLWKPTGGGRPLEDLLRDPATRGEAWREALPALRVWILEYRAEVGDLFAHPGEYPAFIVWIALCALKCKEEQAKAIYRFLIDRVFKKVAWHGSKEFHEHLGYISEKEPDHTALPAHPDDRDAPPIPPSPRDIDQELYTHFVEAVLKDVYLVTVNVLGYLRTAARSHLYDLHKRAQARPALELLALAEDEEGEVPTEDEALSVLSRSDETMVAAAEELELSDQLDRMAPLTPREREAAALLLRGYSWVECADMMRVSRPRMTALRRQLAGKLRPRRGDQTFLGPEC